MKFKKIHSWDLNPRQAVKIQDDLARRIKLKRFRLKPELIAGADVSFKGRKAIGAIVILKLPEFKIIEQVRKSTTTAYPYIPGLLTFREGPVLEKCFKAIKFEPDVIIFDGQGLAHPRNMGIAMHLGILLDKPTIGSAKSRLFGNYLAPEESRGSFTYLLDNEGKKVGAVLRTRDAVRPVYVSPGYKMDIHSALKLILMCTKKYRIPEPIRLAHHLTKET